MHNYAPLFSAMVLFTLQQLLYMYGVNNRAETNIKFKIRIRSLNGKVSKYPNILNTKILDKI